MNVHFIAIGGSAMHNLAIALHKKGFVITGSDDEIFEPSRSRLNIYGILPESIGWDESRISEKLDAIVLGMHARLDNPELIKAQKLGIKIYSYPEYLYEQSKNKTRIVIGGSHGKTTITAMILHVLQKCNIDADYMVGAQLDGFDVMVKITDNASYMILEGDEYLTSSIDRRPKFHVYKPNIALISGIAWDHINVFPTIENYIEQFKIFINCIEENGDLVYCEDDANVKSISLSTDHKINKFAYNVPEHVVENGITKIIHQSKEYELQIFGKHNLLNLSGAKIVCNRIGINDFDFYEAIKSFKGASKRLELVAENSKTAVYKDFAHAPSKVKATIAAVKEKYPQRKIIACLELHTFSSLNAEFLSQYKKSMDEADEPIVFYSQHALEIKKLPSISVEEICNAFDNKNIKVFNDSFALVNHLLSYEIENSTLLLMSSGNFNGLNFAEFGEKIINQ